MIPIVPNDDPEVRLDFEEIHEGGLGNRDLIWIPIKDIFSKNYFKPFES